MSTDIDNPAKLEKIIDAVADRLEKTDVLSDDYSNILDKYDRLNKINKNNRPEPIPVPEVVVDKDRVRLKDLLPIVGSLGGIAIIVVFEAFGHTLTSKATAFVSKPK